MTDIAENKPVIHAVTGKLVTLCGSIEQALRLIKGKGGYIEVKKEIMADLDGIVIKDLRNKTIKD